MRVLSAARCSKGGKALGNRNVSELDDHHFGHLELLLVVAQRMLRNAQICWYIGVTKARSGIPTQRFMQMLGTASMRYVNSIQFQVYTAASLMPSCPIRYCSKSVQLMFNVQAVATDCRKAPRIWRCFFPKRTLAIFGSNMQQRNLCATKTAFEIFDISVPGSVCVNLLFYCPPGNVRFWKYNVYSGPSNEGWDVVPSMLHLWLYFILYRVSFINVKLFTGLATTWAWLVLVQGSRHTFSLVFRSTCANSIHWAEIITKWPCRWNTTGAAVWVNLGDPQSLWISLNVYGSIYG